MDNAKNGKCYILFKKFSRYLCDVLYGTSRNTEKISTQHMMSGNNVNKPNDTRKIAYPLNEVQHTFLLILLYLHVKIDIDINVFCFILQ